MTTTTRSDALHDALERLQGYTYFDAPGFACHGTMGAETLSALGYDELVPSWVERYKARHEPLPRPPRQERLTTEERSWRPALGDPARVTDWADLFLEELGTRPWQDVVARWVPVLLPGYGGALTHGLLRAAHAVRAIRVDQPLSLPMATELASGLALWAASFRRLPGTPSLRGTRSLHDAIVELPRPPQPWTLFEAGTFARMAEIDDFPSVVECLGPAEGVDDALGALTSTFCDVVVSYPEVPALPLVHTVTPASALRALLPFVPDLSVDAVYAQLWHVNAAIVTAFTPARRGAGPLPSCEEELTPTDLIARAVQHGDVHVLKLTDACVREHARRPDGAYLRAARHLLDQLAPW
jgi:hypothetical protein